MRRQKASSGKRYRREKIEIKIIKTFITLAFWKSIFLKLGNLILLTIKIDIPKTKATKTKE